MQFFAHTNFIYFLCVCFKTKKYFCVLILWYMKKIQLWQAVGQLSWNLIIEFVFVLALASLTLASRWFSYQKHASAQLQNSVWDWTSHSSALVSRVLIKYTHDAAVSSSMLEFVWMLVLFILGMPACLFISVLCSLKPTPLGLQYYCCSPPHLVFYQLMPLIWCDKTLAKGVFSGFQCSKHYRRKQKL